MIVTKNGVLNKVIVEKLKVDSTEFTYSDFPCYFKENRDKLAATNRRWMCKKGKRLTITADF